MKLGLMFANILQFTETGGLVDLAQGAEAAGIESLWTIEHVVFPDGYESEYPYDRSRKMPMSADTPAPDPLIWLAWAAAHTERLRLGTGILILPQRNPLVLAKEVATLDHLSGGRLELGVGIGWLREEFDALGIPFADRAARTEDHIAAMRALWDGDNASHDGPFTRFTRVTVNPKPTRGRVPIHIGGHSRAAAERAGRLGDGFFPGKGNLAELVDVARQAAADHGRDPEALEVTAFHPGLAGADPAEGIGALRDQGVDRAVAPAFLFLQDTRDALADYVQRTGVTPH